MPRPSQWREKGLEEVKEEDDDEEDDDDDDGPAGGPAPARARASRTRAHPASSVPGDAIDDADLSGTETALKDDAGTRRRRGPGRDRGDDVGGPPATLDRPAFPGRKRRKLSISPLSSPGSAAGRGGEEDEGDVEGEKDVDLKQDVDLEQDVDLIPETSHDAASRPRGLAAAEEGTSREAVPQPVFQAAPAFRTADADAGSDRFTMPRSSPQGRPAGFLAGGLAAELQGWLSEARGWQGEAPLRIRLEEARPGRRMQLVRGHVVGDGSDGRSRLFLLAGEGRSAQPSTGLLLEAGTELSLGRPIWDLDLHEGEVWTVASDWDFVSGPVPGREDRS